MVPVRSHAPEELNFINQNVSERPFRKFADPKRAHGRKIKKFLPRPKDELPHFDTRDEIRLEFFASNHWKWVTGETLLIAWGLY